MGWGEKRGPGWEHDPVAVELQFQEIRKRQVGGVDGQDWVGVRGRCEGGFFWGRGRGGELFKARQRAAPAITAEIAAGAAVSSSPAERTVQYFG